MNNEPCPICDRAVEAVSYIGDRDSYRMGCAACGTYVISMEARDDLPGTLTKEQKYVLSGVVRDASEQGNELTVLNSNVQQILDSATIPHDPLEAMDRVLMHVQRHASTAATQVIITSSADYPLAFARGPEEFHCLLQNCFELGYLEKHLRPEDEGRQVHVRIGCEGWKRLRTLSEMAANSHQVEESKQTEDAHRTINQDLGEVRQHAYILFMDIPGYSKLNDDAMLSSVHKLYDVVQESIKSANVVEKNFHQLPTGDGMCLCFFADQIVNLETALQVAIGIAQGINALPDNTVLSKKNVRLGLHQGEVFRTKLFNRENVAGDAINTAQRVMDFGDGKHILLSELTGDSLFRLSKYQSVLREVPHVHWDKHQKEYKVYSYYDGKIGDPTWPSRGLRPADDEVMHGTVSGAAWQARSPEWFAVDAGPFESAIAFTKHGCWPKEVTVDSVVSNPTAPHEWRVGVEFRTAHNNNSTRLQFHIAPRLSDCKLYGFKGDTGGKSPTFTNLSPPPPTHDRMHKLRAVFDGSAARCYVDDVLFFEEEFDTPEDRLAAVALMAWGPSFSAEFRNLRIEWKPRS
ncbi:MAG: hypothetical protein HY318_05635 [Armatimonadetes bacterium]|nr:hypothetical protein [Armatimonadota bacterium]